MEKRVSVTAVILLAVGLIWTCTASASDKIKVLGNTDWVSGDSRLTLEMPGVAHPYLKVTSNTAADLQWIEMTVPFEYGATIKGVMLCYQTPNRGTFISQVRLAEYLLPKSATVHHDDGTDLMSTDGACYFSPVNDYTPGGSVNLSLRLNFGSPGDEIRLGALAILADAN